MTTPNTILPFPGGRPNSPDEAGVPPFFATGGPLHRRHEGLERLRTWLLDVVGCERSLELLLEHADGHGTARLADLLQLSKGAAERVVAAAHRVIYWAAVAELVEAALEDADVCAVALPEVAPLGPDRGWRFVVPDHRTRRSFGDFTRDGLRPHVEALADQLVRKRLYPACLLARRQPAPAPGIVLEMAHHCRSVGEARAVARRLRLPGWIDLRTGEAAALSRAA